MGVRDSNFLCWYLYTHPYPACTDLSYFAVKLPGSIQIVHHSPGICVCPCVRPLVSSFNIGGQCASKGFSSHHWTSRPVLNRHVLKKHPFVLFMLTYEDDLFRDHTWVLVLLYELIERCCPLFADTNWERYIYVIEIANKKVLCFDVCNFLESSGHFIPDTEYNISTIWKIALAQLIL